MLKIAVCIKQVPERSEGGMDPKKGVIIRKGLKSVINVYDLPAIETALRIKEATDGVVHVFTMGPAGAESVIRDAYAMGADEGFLLTDKAFAGADVLATSYTLMQGLKAAGSYDIIICGKQTTDGDTAQVGGSLARWLGIPYISMTAEIKESAADGLHLLQETDDELLTLRVPYPCLISVERDIYVPRLPTLKLKMACKKKPVTILGLHSLEDGDENHYGQKGSATKVTRIYPAEKTEYSEIIRKDSHEAAEEIFQIIKEVGYVGSKN